MTAPPATAPAPAPPSARQLSWARRRRALAAFWREFRKDRSGMAGLIFLIVLVILALAAPLLANSRGLSAGAVHEPGQRGPGLALPAGHRRRRPVGADRADLGRPDLAADRLHRDAAVAW